MTENILITPKTKNFISNEFISNNNTLYQKQLKYCGSGFFTSIVDYLETPLEPINRVLYTEDRQGNNPDYVKGNELFEGYEFDDTNRAWTYKVKAINVSDRSNYDDILESESTGFIYNYDNRDGTYTSSFFGETRRFRTESLTTTGLDFPGSKTSFITLLYENTFVNWSYFRGGTLKTTESTNSNKTILRFSTFKRGDNFIEEVTTGRRSEAIERDITSDTLEKSDYYNPGYLDFEIYENIDLRNGRGTINISKNIDLDYWITPYLQKNTLSSEVVTENNIVKNENNYDVVLVSSDMSSAIVNITSSTLEVANIPFVIDKLGQETLLPIDGNTNIDLSSSNYIADKKQINYIDVENNDFLKCKENDINYTGIQTFNFSKPEEAVLSQKKATIKSLKNSNIEIHSASYFPPK